MNALVVADDLTGAMDTGHQFAVRGLETSVRVSVPADGSAPSSVEMADRQPPTVLAVNTETRYADPATARERVSRVASTDDPALVYKKVDSTLRGNVVAELEASIEATGAALAVVAPAFPAAGRVTRDGVHTVDGVPLSESEYADDENGPATAHLSTLLSASRYPVERVSLEDVERGTDALAAIVRDAPGRGGPRILAFDATRPAHLEAIADAAARCDERVVYVGSGGLARYVTVPGLETGASSGTKTETGAKTGTGTKTKPETSRDDATDSPLLERTARVATAEAEIGALGVVGSVNDRTLAQLERVPDAAVVALDPSDVLESPEAAGRAAGSRAGQRLSAGEIAVLTGARSKPTVEETLEIGRREGLERSRIRARVKRGLARAAREAIVVGGEIETETETENEARPLAGLFTTGGDVTVAVCEALETASVALTGAEIEDGIPVGSLETGPAAGTPIVTKAGGFGGESVIVNSLNRLRRGDLE